MVEKLHFRHLIVNISLNKCHNEHLFTSSYCLQVINILNFLRWKFRSRSRGRKRELRRLVANINLHTSRTQPFVPALTVFEILIFLNCDLENLGEGHRKKRDLCSSITNVWVYCWFFFHKFCCPATYKNKQMSHTYTVRDQGDVYRKNLHSRFD